MKMPLCTYGVLHSPEKQGLCYAPVYEVPSDSYRRILNRHAMVIAIVCVSYEDSKFKDTMNVNVRQLTIARQIYSGYVAVCLKSCQSTHLGHERRGYQLLTDDMQSRLNIGSPLTGYPGTFVGVQVQDQIQEIWFVRL